MNITKSLKSKLDSLMSAAKEDNPNANWKNLVTGLLILVLVGLFSVWYFSNTPSEAPFLDNLIETNDQSGADDMGGSEQAGQVEQVEQVEEGVVVVGEDEGLWQVAERVCGDGEKYKYLAEANGMNIWYAPVVPGQKLVLDCGPTE